MNQLKKIMPGVFRNKDAKNMQSHAPKHHKSPFREGFLTPDRRRWIIVALVFFAMVLSYVDRVTVSFLEKEIKDVFGIGNQGYAGIVIIFTICYAIMYPISGWLIDRFGGGKGVRRLMLGSIVTWSLACIGTAFAWGVRVFGSFRAILGFAEPMVNTVQIRVVTEWFPQKLRATANGFCTAGGTIGMVIAAPLLVALKETFNWQMAFIVPGVLGLILAVLWMVFYRNPPAEVLAENIGVSSASNEPAFTWSQLWKTRTLWGVLLCRFISDPVWYFCMFWTPFFLKKTAGFSEMQVGYYGWIPFLCAALGGLCTAMLSDRFVRGGMNPLRSRKVVILGAACLMPLFAFTPHLGGFYVLVLFCLASVMSLSCLFSLNVVIVEALPTRNVGGVLGIAAGCGAVGSVLFTNFVGKTLDSGNPVIIFTVMGCLHLIAASILWVLVRKESPAQKPQPLSVEN